MPPDFALDLDRLSATLAAGAVALTGVGSSAWALPPPPLPPEFEVLLIEARRLSPPMQAVVLRQFLGGLDRRQLPMAMARLREAYVPPSEALALASDTLAALLRRLDPRVCELVVGQVLLADPIDVPPRLWAQYLDRLDLVQREVAVACMNQWRAAAPDPLAPAPADPLARLAAERLAQWVKIGLPDIPRRPPHRPPTERIRIERAIEADLGGGRLTIEQLLQTKLGSLQVQYRRPDQSEANRRAVLAAIAQVVKRRRRLAVWGSRWNEVPWWTLGKSLPQ